MFILLTIFYIELELGMELDIVQNVYENKTEIYPIQKPLINGVHKTELFELFRTNIKIIFTRL